MHKNPDTNMTLEQLKDVLNAEILCGEDLLHLQIETVFSSDLMSDVLAFVRPASLLLTGLTNPQVVRTAEMSEVSLICFVCGKCPLEATIHLAKEKKIPLLVTDLSMYESCGLLFGKGLSGGYDS